MNANEDYKRGFNAGFDQGERNGKTLADITIRQQQSEIEALKAKLQLHEAMDKQCASLMQQFRKAQEK